LLLTSLLDAGLDPADLGEDLVGGGGPDEWLGVGVPVVDVALRNLAGTVGSDPCRLLIFADKSVVEK